jgi:hypothetical protein
VKRLGQRDGFFHKRLLCFPRGGVAGDAFCHFGDQDRMAAGGFREALRIAAFAQPRAAEDEQAPARIR